MAFKQCQKLLNMHFCKFILYPLKRALLGLQTAKTQELRGASPPRPRPGALKDYRDHDFPNTEFSYFLTIDTRQ